MILMLQEALWSFVKEVQITIPLNIPSPDLNQGKLFFQLFTKVIYHLFPVNCLNYYRIGGIPRNEFRMARGGSSGDRARGALRGRAFKKTPIERDSNTETSYYTTTRSKFQESLKNQENVQGKYYDDKRINGVNLPLSLEYTKFNICFVLKYTS